MQNAIFSWVFTIEYYICGMEILFYIVSIVIIVALLALLVVPIWHGIKQARTKPNDNKTIVVNIVITEEQDFHLRQYEKMKKERKAKKCHFSGSSDVMRIAQGKSSWF